MIVGIILYGVALIIDLIGVLMPDLAYDLMNAPFLKGSITAFIFPLSTVFQIINIALLIAFYLIMHKYKGSEKRVIGIVFIIIYCVINVILPYALNTESQSYALLYGENVLAALGTLRTYINIFTHPFTTVSIVFVLIAIGRYGIIKKENNAEMLQYNENERTKEND